jgi:hypothetical protein
MTESTDEVLSHICEHCGKRFYRRRYVNRYNRPDGAPVPAKYCSLTCRKDVYRVRQGYSRSVPRVDATDVPSRSVPLSTPLLMASAPPLKTDSTFDRLRGDAVLSNWKPSGDGKNCPNIPEFLRRA